LLLVGAFWFSGPSKPFRHGFSLASFEMESVPFFPFAQSKIPSSAEPTRFPTPTIFVVRVVVVVVVAIHP